VTRGYDKFRFQKIGRQFPPCTVKLIIVHYHLRPGGIRRIIELATPYLVRALPAVDTVVLAGGEAADAKWNQLFARLLHPVRVEFAVVPALGYYSEQTGTATPTARKLAAALQPIFAGATAENCLAWAHNLGIGRNLLLTRELTRLCAAQGVPLVAHHHDWWFDNRWLRWPEIRRSGFRTMAAVAREVFADSPRLRHAAINHEEAAILNQHFPATSAWLPNLAARNETPAPGRVRGARDWLQHRLGTTPAPVWILPCRLLRRKNVAEALLLTRWLRPEAWLVTTGGASSADEQRYFDQLQQAAHQHHWRLRLGVLQGDEAHKPSVPELLAASEAVLLTSIQEGFGLPYLEAAAAARPLLARNLPNIAPDLHRFGFRFPQAYDEILIAPELFDLAAEQARQQKLFTRWRRLLPATLRARTGQPAGLAPMAATTGIPFSRLTLTAQLEVLAQPVARSWELCAPLNPFLRVWRRRAAAQKLGVTHWPRSADHWLSGATYARRFVELVEAPGTVRRVQVSARRVQQDFFQKKLCAANLYPLLWATDS
jgi:glycosyltransferase involved in cell wall biosynthesis